MRAGRPTRRGPHCLRRAKAPWRRLPSSPPKTADEPVSEPQRLLRCYVPGHGPDSQDRKGHYPGPRAILPVDASWLDGQVRRERLGHKAVAVPPNATGMEQTARQKTGFAQRTGDPEPARWNRCADDSDAANPRPSEAPGSIRRGSCEILIARREYGGTPRENPVVPTAPAHERRHDRLPTQRIP